MAHRAAPLTVSLPFERPGNIEQIKQVAQSIIAQGHPVSDAGGQVCYVLPGKALAFRWHALPGNAMKEIVPLLCSVFNIENTSGFSNGPIVLA